MSFLKYFTNTQSSFVTGTLYIAVDDTADVYVNSIKVGSASHGTVDQFSVSLPPGQNYIVVAAKNTGTATNPAGLRILLQAQSGGELAVSDSSWTYKFGLNLPATASPTASPSASPTAASGKNSSIEFDRS